MQYAILVAPCAAAAALLFALFTARKVLRMPEGEKESGIAAVIRKGANAFLKRQYLVVSVFFGCMFVVLGILAPVGFVSPFMPFAFLTGGAFSGLSGFFGMKIATAANARTATACGKSINKGLRAAFSAGSVMGLIVVGLGLCDLVLLLLVWLWARFWGARRFGAAFLNVTGQFVAIFVVWGCFQLLCMAAVIIWNNGGFRALHHHLDRPEEPERVIVVNPEAVEPQSVDGGN